MMGICGSAKIVKVRRRMRRKQHIRRIFVGNLLAMVRVNGRIEWVIKVMFIVSFTTRVISG